ncbi:MAG: hypothetical protein JJU36_14295 [Phycisphaeraceae bacterium]|nr:hypothetical protein [Phycisphaeraceae bacterium]
MSDDITNLMSSASEALATMRYLECERLCARALRQAQHEDNWIEFSRILLPLQESRRQRRLLAADTAVRLGASVSSQRDQLLPPLGSAGCLLLTGHDAMHDVQPLLKIADERSLFLELLVAGIDSTKGDWNLIAPGLGSVDCPMEAPPHELQNHWITAARKSDLARAAAWFLEASERLGDRVLDAAPTMKRARERADYLLRALDVVRDHELLHQHLAETAVELARRAYHSL